MGFKVQDSLKKRLFSVIFHATSHNKDAAQALFWQQVTLQTAH
jgi:hypothetical protein